MATVFNINNVTLEQCPVCDADPLTSAFRAGDGRLVYNICCCNRECKRRYGVFGTNAAEVIRDWNNMKKKENKDEQKRKKEIQKRKS